MVDTRTYKYGLVAAAAAARDIREALGISLVPCYIGGTLLFANSSVTLRCLDSEGARILEE